MAQKENLCVCLCVCLFVCMFVCVFVYLFICLFVCLLVCLLVRLFVCILLTLFLSLSTTRNSSRCMGTLAFISYLHRYFDCLFPYDKKKHSNIYSRKIFLSYWSLVRDKAKEKKDDTGNCMENTFSCLIIFFSFFFSYFILTLPVCHFVAMSIIDDSLLFGMSNIFRTKLLFLVSVSLFLVQSNFYSFWSGYLQVRLNWLLMEYHVQSKLRISRCALSNTSNMD